METPFFDLIQAILELIRRTATDLPADVEAALRAALDREDPASAAYSALATILENVELSRARSTPICQDTGTPLFFVDYPPGYTQRGLRAQIRAAVAEATRKTYLRPNAVDALSGHNSGDNLGDEHFPTIHFTEIETGPLTIALILKGGGCENVGAQYALPDRRLGAGRDLEGVRRAALDAVWQAQGEGCAPGFLGITIGGDRTSGYAASKEVLLQPVAAPNPEPQLAALTARLVAEANQLGIGPMGFGGQSTLLDAKISAAHRLPASFFVTVSYMCWAYRRRVMVVEGEKVVYR